MNRNNISQGLTLIIVGVVFLLMALGILDWDIFRYAVKLWPLILILVGVNMIFSNRYWLKILSVIIYIAIVILMTIFSEYHVFDIKNIGTANVSIEQNYSSDNILKNYNI